MLSLGQTSKAFRPGQTVNGRLLSRVDGGYLVDLGNSCRGIAKTDVALNPGKEVLVKVTGLATGGVFALQLMFGGFR